MPDQRLVIPQFMAVFIKSLVVILGVAECGYPWQFSCITAGLMVLFFGLFADFYLRAYSKSKKNATNGKANGVYENGHKLS